ncbi:MAG: glycosyltransferase family 9 protein [Acidaminococcales bacterium]|jgi:heptosyltransferase-2|nr:glycosyltransferase family 9 protein [Acidaminococcales bacterium]
MKINEAGNIIVTFLMQMGDLALTTPFLHALRRAAPQAKISYLIDEKWLDIMSENPDLDEVLTVDRKGRDRGLPALWRRAAGLRRRPFDLLINLNPSERCSFLAAFSGAKYKAGAVHRLFSPFFDRPLRLDRSLHAADMYLDVLRRLGCPAADGAGLKIIPPPAGEERAAAFFAASGIADGDKLAGFNVGSASAAKRWLPERFAIVADHLADKGFKIVFFGSAAELPIVEEAAARMKARPIVATGRLTVGALAAAIRRMNIFITNDSGPMHLAVSQKVPLLAFYGPSKPELYGPYKAEGAIVLRAEPICPGCRDRMKHQCPDMRCMTGITAERAAAAADRLAARNGFYRRLEGKRK